MDTAGLLDTSRRSRAWIALLVLVAICVGAAYLASRVQTDGGRIAITNQEFRNPTGIPVRAKLFRPIGATTGRKAPGAVFIHGYQSTRETGDPIAIELARRGVVVLSIDALGRGNSGNPVADVESPEFDSTFGGRTALHYLASLPFVDRQRVGMLGHSLGAETCFAIARDDPAVRGVALVGWAYTAEATPEMPRNMLMVYGRYDEFRDRMTGTRDLAAEWMRSEQTRAAFGFDGPELGKTYGDFARGTARRVVLPEAMHIQEPHHAPAIAEVIEWMRRALEPEPDLWIDPADQIWSDKEWATLVAMLSGLGAILPLALILLRRWPFTSLRGPAPSGPGPCGRGELARHGVVNGLLMMLYLPLALVMFGIHKYLAPIDGVFPMMVVNGIVWWFLWINVIGFFLFRRWYEKRARAGGPSLADLGISFSPSRLHIAWDELGKSFLLAFLLVGFAYLLEHVIESIFVVDYRFVLAFASDLTGRRVLMLMLYYPPLLAGFLQLGFFLHGQLRRAAARTWLGTFVRWTLVVLVVLITPLLVHLAIQYVPLYASGAIPLVGPGGMFVLFVINIFHIIGVLVMVVPISTWCFQLTGRPYLGAFVCAGLVAWFFASSQVIAPVPI
jgi:dienelactone hydrolase